MANKNHILYSRAIMKWKAHLALLSVALIYGANYTIAKNVLDQNYLESNGFILLRIMVITPIIVLVVASVYLKENISRNKVIGILVGMLGAALLIIKGGSGNDSMSSALGDMYILFNATSYAIYLVLVKRLMRKYHPFTVMKWIFSFGLVVVMPFGAGDLVGVDWSEFPSSIWIAIGYVLLFTTFFAYLLNAYALTMVNPTTASAYIYLQPLIASTIAVIWYNDKLSLIKIVSGLMIFAGVYLISSKIKVKSKIERK